jgi:hypothetical protein
MGEPDDIRRRYDSETYSEYVGYLKHAAVRLRDAAPQPDFSSQSPAAKEKLRLFMVWANQLRILAVSLHRSFGSSLELRCAAQTLFKEDACGKHDTPEDVARDERWFLKNVQALYDAVKSDMTRAILVLDHDCE